MQTRDDTGDDILMIHVRCSGNLLESKPFHKESLLIGRDPACDLRIENDSVSRFHARIARQATGFTIEDLESKNGTLLNGDPVTKGSLANGDVVRTGKLELTIEIFTSKVSGDTDDDLFVRGLAQDTIEVTSKRSPGSGA